MGEGLVLSWYAKTAKKRKKRNTTLRKHTVFSCLCAKQRRDTSKMQKHAKNVTQNRENTMFLAVFVQSNEKTQAKRIEDVGRVRHPATLLGKSWQDMGEALSWSLSSLRVLTAHRGRFVRVFLFFCTMATGKTLKTLHFIVFSRRRLTFFYVFCCLS